MPYSLPISGTPFSTSTHATVLSVKDSEFADFSLLQSVLIISQPNLPLLLHKYGKCFKKVFSVDSVEEKFRHLNCKAEERICSLFPGMVNELLICNTGVHCIKEVNWLMGKSDEGKENDVS